MTNETLKNRLGALSLAVTDRMLASTEDVGTFGTTACAALVAACHQAESPTIGDLAKICSVSHSVMVRTVEQLVDNKLLSRKAGIDRRSVRLTPTKAGLSYRDKILAKRSVALDRVVSVLSEAERATLKSLLSRMLTALTSDRVESEKICRLCDTVACGADCPSELAAINFEQANTAGQSLQ
jgi:DNA-binding MarR family transcriptional regulator